MLYCRMMITLEDVKISFNPKVLENHGDVDEGLVTKEVSWRRGHVKRVGQGLKKKKGICWVCGGNK